MFPFDPSPDEARNWFYSGDNWPEQDWHLFLCNGRCDMVVFECASDPDCPKQNDAINALYMLVGDCFHSDKDADRVEQLASLISAGKRSGSHSLAEWAHEAESLLSNRMEFDYEYWCLR